MLHPSGQGVPCHRLITASLAGNRGVGRSEGGNHAQRAKTSGSVTCGSTMLSSRETLAAPVIIEMAEHFPLVREPRGRLYMTRNRNGNRFELLLTGVHHDNYHLEHHLNPNVPMWHLPKSQQVRLQNPAYRLWDEQWGGIFTKCDRKPTRKTFY